VRQTLFDMLLHAPWAGRESVVGVSVLDAYAGTGALGLEAVSRGAASAVLMERDRVAQGVIKANIAACRMEDRVRLLRCDVTGPPRTGEACGLVFLDPPYGQGLIARGMKALGRAGWLGEGALIVAESGADEAIVATGAVLAEKVMGAARVSIWRHRVG